MVEVRFYLFTLAPAFVPTSIGALTFNIAAWNR